MCLFIDFSTAFDKVHYWTFFKQLLDDSVNSHLVALLALTNDRWAKKMKVEFSFLVTRQY